MEEVLTIGGRRRVPSFLVFIFIILRQYISIFLFRLTNGTLSRQQIGPDNEPLVSYCVNSWDQSLFPKLAQNLVFFYSQTIKWYHSINLNSKLISLASESGKLRLIFFSLLHSWM